MKRSPMPAISNLRTGAALVFNIIRQGAAYSIVPRDSGQLNDVACRPGHYEPPVATQPVFGKPPTQSLERSLGDGGTLGTWGYDLVHVSQENPAREVKGGGSLHPIPRLEK